MSEDHYQTERNTCETALAAAVAVSEAGIGLLDGWQGHWAAFLHARTIVNTMTIFDVIDAGVRSGGEARPLDHFSVASIARTAVEAALMMLYISDPSLSSEQWELRHLILQLHDTSHRSRMFRAREAGENGEEVKQMRCREEETKQRASFLQEGFAAAWMPSFHADIAIRPSSRPTRPSLRPGRRCSATSSPATTTARPPPATLCRYRS